MDGLAVEVVDVGEVPSGLEVTVDDGPVPVGLEVVVDDGVVISGLKVVFDEDPVTLFVEFEFGAGTMIFGFVVVSVIGTGLQLGGKLKGH